MHLTDFTVKSLSPPKTGQTDFVDDALPGFSLRVGLRTKTFMLLVSKAGKRERITIGRYPVISLSQARAKAKELLAQRTLGMKEAKATITFKVALDLFLTHHCKVNNRPDTAYETERLLARHFVPAFQHRSLEDIRTQDILSVIDRLMDTPSECNHAFTAVRTFFRWSMRRGYIEQNPCDRLQRPTKSVARSRVLTDGEIRKVWNAASQMGTYGAIVRLLLLTGQRLNEIATLRWEYINKKDKTITLPPERTKNGREHTFPFGAMTAGILGEAAEGLLFPTEKDSGVAFNNWSTAKHALDKLYPIPHWTLHDLRRTFATKLAALGASIHVTEKLLNHSSGTVSGVAAIYNRHSYMDEMRSAIAGWEIHLAFLLRQ